MKEEINYYNINNPHKALERIINNLVSIYISDYGNEYEEIIKEKINNTIFIFDSNPIETKNFIGKNLDKIKDNRKLLKTEIEYLDYIKEKKKIEKEIKTVFLNYIKKYTYIDINIDKDKVYNLDFDSYSLENNIKLERDNTQLEEKEKILKRRKEYKLDYLEISMRPLTDWQQIEKIIKYKNSLELYKKIELIKRTKWGHRIKREILRNNKTELSDLQLANILFDDDNNATTSIIIDNDNNKKTICYMPLIHNVEKSSLDKILLHELRHVIETNDESIGISRISNQQYDTLNEIRTDKNALKDKLRLNNQTIFSDKKSNSLYEALFAYTGDFFEEHKNVLDYIAISGKIELLEKLFNHDELILYDYYLHDIEEAIINKKELPINEKIKEQLIKTLRSNYKNNK